MSSSPCVLSVLVIACVLSGAVGADDWVAEPPAYVDLPDEGAPPWTVWPLDGNSTENLTVFLNMDTEPPLYEGEAANFSVWWEWKGDGRSPDGPGSMFLGINGTWPVERTGRVAVTNYDNRTLWSGSSDLVPTAPNSTVMARLEVAGEMVNLSSTFMVLPLRIAQSVRLVLPEAEGPLELNRTAVQVELENSGGAPALEQIVDVRYGGRIVETFHVPVVPPGGNRTLEVELVPVYGGGDIEIFIVQGPGAPYLMASLPLPVRANRLLDVVSVSVEPASVEEGDSVRLMATIANRGNATSSGEAMEFLVDGRVVVTVPLDPIAPGSVVDVTVRWTSRGVGDHAVSARTREGQLDVPTASLGVQWESPLPGGGTLVLVLSLAALVRLVGRRSGSARRA